MDPTPGIAYGQNVRITLTVYNYVAPKPTCDPNKTPTPSASSSPILPSGSVPVSPPVSPSTSPTTAPTNTLPPC
jgi:hypothetical protein